MIFYRKNVQQIAIATVSPVTTKTILPCHNSLTNVVTQRNYESKISQLFTTPKNISNSKTNVLYIGIDLINIVCKSYEYDIYDNLTNLIKTSSLL